MRTVDDLLRAPPRRSGWRRLAPAALRLATVVMVLLAVAAVGVRAAGLQPLTVLTGSMSPTIAPGDVVLVDAMPATAMRRGEIVTFAHPFRPGRTLTHRVRDVRAAPAPVDGRPGLAVVTRGDANSGPERWSIPRDGRVGHVRAVLPGVPALRSLLAGPGRAVVLGGLTLAAVLALVVAALRAPRARPTT